MFCIRSIVVSFALWRLSAGVIIRPSRYVPENRDIEAISQEYINDEADETDALEFIELKPKYTQQTQSQDQELLTSILMKVKDLEGSNQQLREDLIKTQMNLKETKRRNKPVVQLEPVKKEDDSASFWSVICGIAKHLIGKFLGFFNINLWAEIINFWVVIGFAVDWGFFVIFLSNNNVKKIQFSILLRHISIRRWWVHKSKQVSQLQVQNFPYLTTISNLIRFRKIS